MIISTANADPYKWGNDCDGWPLVESGPLSVKEEKIPPGAGEIRHYHTYSTQFFYVLDGELQIEIEGDRFTLGKRQGIQVAPMQKHQVCNLSDRGVELLVISQPSTKGDRVDLAD